MRNQNSVTAKILLTIPIVILGIMAACIGMAAMLEFATNRGASYTFFALVGAVSIYLSPFLCMFLSVSGTVFAAIAVRNGEAHSGRLLVIGIVEIIACAAGLVLVANALTNL